MHRRLVVTLVSAVVAALVLAGLGTFALARVGARRYAEGELRGQVEAVSEALSTDGPLLTGGADRPRIVAALRRALRLEGMGLLTLREGGGVVGRPPAGITLSAAEIDALRSGETISGQQGGLVYAASTIERGGTVTAVVLSDRIAIALGGTVLWFLLASGAVVAIAVVAATRLSRSLTEPLRRASEVSRRIAEGDLTARVPEPPAEARDELADVSRSVNAMASALERSRGLEQQFLLSVSHDLRTPLTSIQGYAEALADGTADAPLAGSVIVAESRRLDRLVRDLLALASLDARRFSLEATVVDLLDLVEACVEGFGPEADAAGVVIEVVSEPAVVVLADPDRLAQVVANLLDNALKFARHSVLVRVGSSGGRARVTVDDDGPGIAPADRPHVFERLYVARHRPVRKESGSGLGLAIVRELVVAMDGSVGVDASDRHGARLWFEIPSHDPNTPDTRG